ncbi:hypothetical protein B0H12DRAFT_1103967 [Mycena haematopus]|nr:hypothetical protein B0H12DRAFT_1103967 [Mycena haematopus]
MSKLPPLETVGLDHEGLSVWRFILAAEEAALKVAPRTAGPKYNDNLIGVHVLGFLLHDMWLHDKHSFGLIPYKTLLKEIKSAVDVVPNARTGSEAEAQAHHHVIYTLGLRYRNHLLRVFRSNGGPLPEVSEHPSRPSLEVMRQRIVKEMATPTTLSGAKQRALLRDGYRCMITGGYDFESCDIYPELAARADAQNVHRMYTECAHIFSETAQDSEKKIDYAAGVLQILRTFGLNDKVENLVGGNVHKHFNILTMGSDLHKAFDRMQFWLEEVPGQTNTYNVCSVGNKIFTLAPPPPPRVTFAVDPDVEAACKADNKPVPALPSPSLLAIRAACSRVAHMSGAGEQIDHIFRDLEDTSVMAEDGSTADLLTSRLLQSSHSVLVGA